MDDITVIGKDCKVSYRIDEDFIFFKTNKDIYYFIKKSNTLIKLKISIDDFFNKILEHIEKNISFLYLINQRFVVVDSFIIEHTEVYNDFNKERK